MGGLHSHSCFLAGPPGVGHLSRVSKDSAAWTSGHPRLLANQSCHNGSKPLGTSDPCERRTCCLRCDFWFLLTLLCFHPRVAHLASTFRTQYKQMHWCMWTTHVSSSTLPHSRKKKKNYFLSTQVALRN